MSTARYLGMMNRRRGYVVIGNSLRIWKCLVCGAKPFQYVHDDMTVADWEFHGGECNCPDNQDTWDPDGPWEIDEGPLVVWNEEPA